jgi:hypothetical protein
MMLDRPERLIAIAVIMLLFGCVAPFLMVIQVVQSTFFLNFLAFGSSVAGLFIGIIGIAQMRGRIKNKGDGSFYE